jgi:hypothetical protein
MADKKISQLTALVSAASNDLYETSANGTGSFKETRAQQNTYWNANVQLPSSAKVTGLDGQLTSIKSLKSGAIHVTPGASDVGATGSPILPFGTVTLAYAYGISLGVPFTLLCAPGTHTFGSLQLVPRGFIEGYGIGSTILNCTGSITLDETKWISTGAPDKSGFLNATLIFNITSLTISPSFSANLYFINVDGISTTPLIQGFTNAVYINGSRFNYMNFVGSLVYLTDSHIIGKILSSTRNPDTELDIADCYVQSIGCTHADDINISSYGSFSNYTTVISPYFENTGRLINLTGDNTNLNINSETTNTQIVSGEPIINYLDLNIVDESDTTIDLSLYKPMSCIRTTGSVSPYTYIVATVPNDAFYNFPIGTKFKFEQVSSSLVKIEPQDGTVTVATLGGYEPISIGTKSIFYVEKLAANNWVVYGDLSGTNEIIVIEPSATFDLSIANPNTFFRTYGSGSPNVIFTVPKDATYNFPIGTTFGFEQVSASPVQLTAEDGTVTVATLGGDVPLSIGPASVFFLKKVASNNWVAYGDLSGPAQQFYYWTGDGDLQPNSNNVAGSASLVTLTLPDTSAFPAPYGAEISISWGNTGGWKIQCNPADLIYVGDKVSSLGGYIASTGVGDGGTLKLIAPSIWSMRGIQGTISIDGTATNNAINQDESSLIVTSSVNPMIPGITYITNSGSLITLTLPATLNVTEDVFAVMGRGTGGWKIAQQSGQTINWTASSSTTTGTSGYLQFTDQYDAVKLRPISSTNLGVESSKGNITVA